jgi:DNA-binding transcriptional MerR regulator
LGKGADQLEQATLLTLPQLAAMVGVEYRTLHSWVKRGLVEPSLQRSRGTGVPNLFSREDAVKTKVIAELRHAGVPFDLLAEAAEGLAAHPAALREGAMVLVNGSVTIASDRQLLERVAAEPLTLVYNTRHAISTLANSFAGESRRSGA